MEALWLLKINWVGHHLLLLNVVDFDQIWIVDHISLLGSSLEYWLVNCWISQRIDFDYFVDDLEHCISMLNIWWKPNRRRIWKDFPSCGVFSLLFDQIFCLLSLLLVVFYYILDLLFYLQLCVVIGRLNLFKSDF